MTQLGSPFDLYEVIEQIGDGSFGTVHKAKNKHSHKIVAIKIMKKKYQTVEDCAGQFEPKLVHLLPIHINIVQLYDSFLSPTCDLAFIMEFMDGGNLYQLMRERREHNLPFNHCELKNILHQILSAVSHIHNHKIFHRDMKPENLLLDYSIGKPIIKLADFGLAKELESNPPYTEYVSTRWYRAPEVLLRSTEYSYPVDLWAIGTIFAELITLEPLFPGESEIDQIFRICSILGSPGNRLGVGVAHKKRVNRQEKRLSPGFARKKTVITSDIQSVSITTTNSTMSPLDGGGEWKEGVKLAYKIGFQFPELKPKPLESVIPNATESMLDLIRHFLFFNPHQRLTADEALKHRFFSETDEPIHHHIPVQPISLEPNAQQKQELDALIDSVSTLKPPSKRIGNTILPPTPSPVCPEWSKGDCPASRHGRLCSAISDEFDNNTWLAQSRPIYSSHQKVHPVTDRPNSSNLWNKYNNQPTHISGTDKTIPTPSVNKRHSYHPVSDTVDIQRNRRLSNIYHHHTPHINNHHNDTVDTLSVNHHSDNAHHHTHNDNIHHDNIHHDNMHHENMHNEIHNDNTHNDNTHNDNTHNDNTHNDNTHNDNTHNDNTHIDNHTHFNMDRLPHYGNQLVKWSPSHPHHIHHYQEQVQVRPESRRCRTPAPFSSSFMKHKYQSHVTTTTPTSIEDNYAPIKYWTPPTTTTSTNTEKITFSSHDIDNTSPWHRKSENRKSFTRLSTRRFNSWLPGDDNEEEDEENKDIDRSVVLHG
ncbi:kinase-like domain-containing protein [Pilobolus umbonatus]|nr:kinase-like domain-containing protein [Pilobolus umbonatus]